MEPIGNEIDLTSADLDTLLQRQAELRCILSAANQELSDIRLALLALRGGDSQRTTRPVLSDHAIARYYQRVIAEGDDIYDEIVPPSVRTTIAAQGDGIYDCGDYHIVVENNTVLTVLTERRYRFRGRATVAPIEEVTP